LINLKLFEILQFFQIFPKIKTFLLKKKFMIMIHFESGKQKIFMIRIVLVILKKLSNFQKKNEIKQAYICRFIYKRLALIKGSSLFFENLH